MMCACPKCVRARAVSTGALVWALAFACGTTAAAWLQRFGVWLVLLFVVGCNAPGEPDALMCFVSWDAEHTEVMLDAADEWHDKTGGAVALRFQYADDGGDCNDDAVRLYLAPPGLRGNDGGPALGVTSGHREWIKFDSDPEWSWLFATTARHELGHFLTSGGDDGGHSLDPSDIMYHSWTPEQDGHLTARDVARFER